VRDKRWRGGALTKASRPLDTERLAESGVSVMRSGQESAQCYDGLIAEEIRRCVLSRVCYQRKGLISWQLISPSHV
jgi:hypothetical protein